MGELSAPVVVLRVTVRAPDLDAFITRYSRHIAGDRIFIFSKAPQRVGTNVRFNLQLTSGEVLLQGRGTVKRVQNDTGDARHPPGMEVQFKPLDERSSTLVDFMMATRAGLTEKVVAKAAPVARAVVPARPSSLPPRPTPLPPIPSLPPPLPPMAASSSSRPHAVAPPPPPPSSPSSSVESAWKAVAPEAAAEAAPSPAARLLSPSTPTPTPPPTPPVAGEPPPVAPDPPLYGAESAATTADPPLYGVEPPLYAADHPVAAAVAAAAAAAAAPPSRSHDLPTIIPPLVDPSVTAPPVFAESWGGDAPANPFSDVSDGAIEYFVEWSIEQSIGPRALPQARFSDVPMALPGESDSREPLSRRRRLAQVGAIFATGVVVGGFAVAMALRRPWSPPLASMEPQAAAATKLAAPTPPAPATDEPVAPPPSAKPGAIGGAELVVTTRPPGASVTIDGAAAGATPLATHVAAGRHEIALAKERYATTTTTTAAPGKLAFDLRRPPATLHITSTPAAADVTVAGERRGKTPIDIRLPGFESYDVRVALAGARPWRKTVYLAHASNRVDAALVVGKTAPPRR